MARAFLVLLVVRRSIVAWVNSILGTYCKGSVHKKGDIILAGSLNYKVVHPTLLRLSLASSIWSVMISLHWNKPTCQRQTDVPDLDTTKNADTLAILLQTIFNTVFQKGDWPSPWKIETVTVIPNNNSPGELRNLICSVKSLSTSC